MNLDTLMEVQNQNNQPPNSELLNAEVSQNHVIKQNLESSSESEEPDEFDNYVVEKVKAVTELILNNCAEDRAKSTDIINKIESIINSQDKVIQGGTIARLLQAVQTRAEINSTAVKMMEACGKILSARKGGNKNVINNTNLAKSNSTNSLIELLQSGINQLGD